MRHQRLISLIVKAFHHLGGRARLQQVYKEVRRLGYDRGGKEPEKIIRSEIQKHSSNSRRFTRNPKDDLFCTPKIRSGIWELREVRANDLDSSRQLPNSPQPDKSPPRQPDPLLRQRVERIAIETTAAYFTGLGYRVESFEQDNVGWDLNAVLGEQDLKLEVKGLSGSQIVVELTPNEYTAMGKHRKSYRVCVVTKALTKPCLEIFAYSPESRQWKSPKQRVLHTREIIAARCSVS